MAHPTRNGLAAAFIPLIAACSSGPDGPLSPLVNQPQPRITVCHFYDGRSTLLAIPLAALQGHLGHGDYVASYAVDRAAATPADDFHFTRITDAIRTVRTLRLTRGELTQGACQVTISVAPGTYVGSFDDTPDATLEVFPLILDMPNVTLKGALTLGRDGYGRANGVPTDPSRITTLAPDRPLADAPAFESMILAIGHPTGSQANIDTIEGLSFRSGHDAGGSGGIGILSLRAAYLTIAGNRFEPGLTSAMDLRASSAIVDHNYANGMGLSCAICAAGPGDYQVVSNEIERGALGGIYVAPSVAGLGFSLGAHPDVPVEPFEVPARADVTASVENNGVVGHLRMPIGFGLRVLAIGPGTSDVPQSATVEVISNSFIRNTFAIILDAGFPVANTLRKGDLDASLDENEFDRSCQNDLLVAFTRHSSALGVTSNPYLENSNFTLRVGGDMPWADVWYSHPAGFGNTLTVDGARIPEGSFVPFDPTRICGA